LLLIALAVAASPTVHTLLDGYRAAGANPSAAAGRAAWTRAVPGEDGPRSCSTCHTADPRAPGQHHTTGEAIDPLAPSVNSASLTDPAKIEKWFGRNCRWTWGRECTSQEKADFLSFLDQ
jgi:hypothetical protein